MTTLIHENAMPFESVNPEFYWKRHKLTVIYDRYTPDGVRQHIVKEEVPENLILDNAEVFSESMFNKAFAQK